jgi:hypothetical protein
MYYMVLKTIFVIEYVVLVLAMCVCVCVLFDLYIGLTYFILNCVKAENGSVKCTHTYMCMYVCLFVSVCVCVCISTYSYE